MSWSRSVSYISLAELDALELDEPTIAYATANSILEETKEQFAKAKAAAKQLIQSGVVGNPTNKRFNVSINGHSNKNQEPDSAWANPCISVGVGQA